MPELLEPAAAVHRVVEVMGMPFSIDARGPGRLSCALDDAFAVLARADALFSTYRADSEISRLNRGELALEDCSSDVREVLVRCERLREQTQGAFDIAAAGRALPGAPVAAVDPSGLVKGWALQRAAGALRAAGVRHHCVNGAGDVSVAGGRPDGRPWRVGIRHPLRADSLCAIVALADGAVATSAAYERGDHVVDPRTGRPARKLASATVIGPDAGTADAYATALFARGRDGLDWIEAEPGYEAMAMLADGGRPATPGFARFLAA